MANDLVGAHVSTPLGRGTVQTTWRRSDGRDRALVSFMPVSDELRLRIDEFTCMGRTAEFVLFVFDASECQVAEQPGQ